jgi:hypothetical protein
MAAETIYRVFVSSTYDDLRAERAEVQKALLKLKCLPVGMELFPSTDEETWEFIKRQIKDSDYYIVIIAGRYGSLAANGVGFTEKEYDYAREIGLPTLAFVHADRSKIEAGKTDLEQDKRDKLQTFIAKATNGPLVSWFNNPHELSGQVLASVIDLKERRPAVGFVRADQAVDYKKYADLLEQNTQLRAELNSIRGERVEAFPSSDEKLLCVLAIRTEGQGVEQAERRKREITWGNIFRFIAEAIIANRADEWTVDQDLANWIGRPIKKEQNAQWDDRATFRQIKMKLFGLGLVDFGTHERPGLSPYPHHTFHRWTLTEYGRKQYGLLAGYSASELWGHNTQLPPAS